jgi:hypothetical protein
MNVGDKILAEGVIGMVGDGFCRVAFGRVGTQAVTHVRIQNEDLHPIKPPKPAKAPIAD